MKKGIKLKCKRKDCLHKWIYRGKSKFYATCPDCHNKVRLNKKL